MQPVLAAAMQAMDKTDKLFKISIIIGFALSHYSLSFIYI